MTCKFTCRLSLIENFFNLFKINFTRSALESVTAPEKSLPARKRTCASARLCHAEYTLLVKTRVKHELVALKLLKLFKLFTLAQAFPPDPSQHEQSSPKFHTKKKCTCVCLGPVYSTPGSIRCLNPRVRASTHGYTRVSKYY